MSAAAAGPRVQRGTGLERMGLGNTGLGPMRPVPEDALLDPEQRKLKAVAREFEAVLLERLLTTMRASHLFKDPLDSGAGMDIFTSMHDAQLGREMARRGSLGLADVIYRELMRPKGAHTPGMPEGQALAPPHS